MVGFVIVSHSAHLAESIVELTAMMAENASIAPAGGLEDGSLGTSFDRIRKAIEDVYSEDGVIILMDMGSAVMTTEMVIESMPDFRIAMSDAPIVEGAVAATIDAICGLDFDTILRNLQDVKKAEKF